MRLFTLYAHILFTAGLYWTKVDCIQISMRDINDDNEYKQIDRAYSGLLSMGIILLIIEVAYAGNETQVTLRSMIHLFLDAVACIFTSWIALDGLSWTTYIYIFVFCV